MWLLALVLWDSGHFPFWASVSSPSGGWGHFWGLLGAARFRVQLSEGQAECCSHVSANALANHTPAGWPEESLAGSDSEDPGPEPPLRVETKVSVELHRQEQANHCSSCPSDPAKPAAALGTQLPEQRKGGGSPGPAGGAQAGRR